jgi:hypothetical protein
MNTRFPFFEGQFSPNIIPTHRPISISSHWNNL